MTVASRTKIPNEWLVTLTEDVSDLDAAADALAARHGFALSARLCVVRSFVATMPDASLAKLRSEPSVTRILLNRRRRAIAA